MAWEPASTVMSLKRSTSRYRAGRVLLLLCLKEIADLLQQQHIIRRRLWLWLETLLAALVQSIQWKHNAEVQCRSHREERKNVSNNRTKAELSVIDREDESAAEIRLAKEHRDEWADKVVDQTVDDLRERATNNNTDCKVNDATAHHKFFKTVENVLQPELPVSRLLVPKFYCTIAAMSEFSQTGTCARRAASFGVTANKTVLESSCEIA